MQAARADLDEALAIVRTIDEFRRVKLIDESFGLFELFMKMRTDWAAANLRTLEADYEVWRAGITDMQRRYQARGLDHVQGRHGNPRWSDGMTRPLYQGGSRMERDFTRHGKPMLEWKWKYNPGPEADALPWTAPDFSETMQTKRQIALIARGAWTGRDTSCNLEYTHIIVIPLRREWR